MKSKLFLVIIALMLGCNVSLAQNEMFTQDDMFFNNDAFFTTSYSEYREVDDEFGIMPILPIQHGGLIDYSAVPDTPEAPLGSGLLLLASMGVAYGIRRRSIDN